MRIMNYMTADINASQSLSAARRAPSIPACSQICLFLDFDGTLIDFARGPDEVHVVAGLVSTLDALHVALDGALALISGRRIGQLDGLLHPLTLPAAGLHGLERRDAAGRVHVADAPVAALRGARHELAEFASSHPGVLLEDKQSALAVHFREAPGVEGLVRSIVSRLAPRLAPEYEVLEGDMVLEIKPSAYDKATAVEAFMQEPPFAGRMPVYVGDDVTDRDGFRAVLKHHGMTVAVGDRVVAQWHLPHPQAARDWLSRIARQGARDAR